VTMGVSTSVFTALESAGYGFFALMALSVGAGLARDASRQWLRWSFLATGAGGVVGAVGALAARPALMLSGFGGSLAAFLVAALLLGRYFRRLELGHPPSISEGE
jgi:hypothetical protein